MTQFGPVPVDKIPDQSSDVVMLVAERWQRSSDAQERWASKARLAVDFMEGRQWSEQDLALAKRQKRPTLVFNIIAPLVRLIEGYHRNNKTDITFQPGNDDLASEEVAEVLTHLEKNVTQGNKIPFVDAAVFADGIITGRGFYRSTLDFDDNDLGEVRSRSKDPFAVYLDPDGDTYDLNESCAYTNTTKWVSIDEIEHTLGKKVATLLRPFTKGQTPMSPVASMMVNDEITPTRYFGQSDDQTWPWWDQFYATMGNFVDQQRKTLRIIEHEHYVSEERHVFIDLETGAKKLVPRDWNRERIQKVIAYAEMQGDPILVEKRRVRTVHWTTMCGDMLLYNQPSPYESFSLTPFFPYFRRGATRGAVDDLIDPQREKNKRRSTEIEIVTKLSNGGWKFHTDSMTPKQKRDLKNFGSSPGFMLEYKGTDLPEPQILQPGPPPSSMERLEQKSEDDIKRISGINAEALGELDKVQSGRAIEARQRQAVISIQVYMDNFKHSKTLLGEKHLEMFQNFYTEPRVFRVLGEDGKFSRMMINQMTMNPNAPTPVREVLNNITLGKYLVVVDESPLSATYLNAQFEEMLTMLEKLGPAIGPAIPMFADLMFDLSTLPRKDEWVERIKQLMGGVPGAGGPPPGGGVPNAGVPSLTAAPQLTHQVTPGGTGAAPVSVV